MDIPVSFTCSTSLDTVHFHGIMDFYRFLEDTGPLQRGKPMVAKPTCLKRQLIMVSYVSLRGAQPAGHGGIGHKISMKFSPDLLTLLCLVDFPRVTGVCFSLCDSSAVAE